MAEGWIKLHRQIIDSEWFTDVNTNHLFMYCLIRANHKDTKWQGIGIKRGAFITSLDTLSRATGLSIMQVRTSLKKLIATSNLTSNASNKNRLITVVNYEQYQDDNKQPNKPVTSQQQTNNKRITTDKNNNNNKNENNDKKKISRVKKREERELIFPTWMDDNLIYLWNEFIEMRIKIKKPPTHLAKEILLSTLEKLFNNGQDPAKVLQQSIVSNWQSLFPIKESNNNGKQYNSKQPTNGISAERAKMLNALGIG